MMKTYRLNRYAEVEGSNASGWTVYNLVTGLAQGPVWPTFADARAAADFIRTFYSTLEG